MIRHAFYLGIFALFIFTQISFAESNGTITVDGVVLKSYPGQPTASAAFGAKSDCPHCPVSCASPEGSYDREAESCKKTSERAQVIIRDGSPEAVAPASRRGTR